MLEPDRFEICDGRPAQGETHSGWSFRNSARSIRDHPIRPHRANPNPLAIQWSGTITNRASKDLAQRFRAAFEASVWDRFVAKGMPASDRAAVTAELDRMRQIGREIDATALKAIDAATGSALGVEAARMTRPRKPDAS